MGMMGILEMGAAVAVGLSAQRAWPLGCDRVFVGGTLSFSLSLFRARSLYISLFQICRAQQCRTTILVGAHLAKV
jgi:hypothetical protein